MPDPAEDPHRAVSRHGIASGLKRDGDVWYDVDAFLLDQVEEVLNKLSDGAIDDEIWGKIVVMEKSKRVAKAYLRHSTVIIDGSEEEFDGKTLGFNAFSNSQRDEQTKEIRQKIKEGVILKMDLHGNIKGMARGTAPVVAQGWRDPKSNCMSEKLIKLQGRINSDEKAYKIFDMRRWKAAVERLAEGDGEFRSLLPRACIRVALAKDGGDMMRTPCWLAVVNLVALDVLIARAPSLMKGSLPLVPRPVALGGETAAINPPVPPIPTIDPATAQLPHIVAAVAAQMNMNQNISNQILNTEQLAQIASALAMNNQSKTAEVPKKSPTRPAQKKERRRPYKKEVDTEDSSGEDSALRSESCSSGNEKTDPKWDERWESSTKSVDILYGGIGDEKEQPKESSKVRGRRPRLQDVIFSMKSSTRSATSDYDSNKETFDSSSCSSTVSHSTKGISEVTKNLKTQEDDKRDVPLPPPPPAPVLPFIRLRSPPSPTSSPSPFHPPSSSLFPHRSSSSPSPRPPSSANSQCYGVFQNKVFDRTEYNSDRRKSIHNPILTSRDAYGSFEPYGSHHPSWHPPPVIRSCSTSSALPPHLHQSPHLHPVSHSPPLLHPHHPSLASSNSTNNNNNSSNQSSPQQSSSLLSSLRRALVDKIRAAHPPREPSIPRASRPVSQCGLPRVLLPSRGALGSASGLAPQARQSLGAPKGRQASSSVSAPKVRQQSPCRRLSRLHT